MSATETRDFPTAVIASLSTGVLLCDFGAMHEAAEFLMGHSIWTHHFGDKGLCSEIKRTIAEQCPGIPTEAPESVNKDNWQDYAAQLVSDLGPIIRIRKGSGLTAMLPTDGIPAHVTVTTIDI